jgi:histidine triad (HIT) family protein
MDCIFCKIIDGEIPSDIIYRDEEVIAFRDISPQAPIHILVVPKKHIDSLTQLDETDYHLIGKIIKVANQLAKEEGVAEKGYRVAINCGEQGGQAVPHLHLHLLAGRKMRPTVG